MGASFKLWASFKMGISFVLKKAKFLCCFLLGLFVFCGFFGFLPASAMETSKVKVYDKIDSLIESAPELLIKNGSVVLRKTEKSDIEALAKILYDYDEKLIKMLFTPNDKPFKSVADAQKYIETECFEKPVVAYTICDKKSNKVLGFIGAEVVNMFVFKVNGVQIFEFLDKKYMDEKIGSEALQAFFDLLLSLNDVSIINVSCWNENEPMKKAINKVIKSSVEKHNASVEAYNSGLKPSEVKKQMAVDQSMDFEVEDLGKLKIGLVVVNGVINGIINFLKEQEGYGEFLKRLSVKIAQRGNNVEFKDVIDILKDLKDMKDVPTLLDFFNIINWMVG